MSNHLLIVKQINSKPQLKADCGIVVVVEAVIIVYGRFDCNRTVDEESIADFYTWHHVVIAVVVVNVFAVESQIKAVLLNVVADAESGFEIVGLVFLAVVLEPSLGQQHPVVGKKEAGLSLSADIKTMLAVPFLTM